MKSKLLTVYDCADLKKNYKLVCLDLEILETSYKTTIIDR